MKESNLFIDIVPVGSRVTCNPAPTDTDQDYLVLCKNIVDADRYFREVGFKLEGSEKYNLHDSDFHSYRLGQVNFIVTGSMTWFNSFNMATKAAKALNLLNKKDRITLFDAIMTYKWRSPEL